MADQDTFKNAVLELSPHLYAFARRLAHDRAMAEDLVQDTMVRALTHRAQFQPGTNLRGWLTVILRNRFFNEVRRRNRGLEVSFAYLDDLAAVDGGQEASLEIKDFHRAFAALPAVRREALNLIAVRGFSYEEAADLVGCPIGTMKSRVSRARTALEIAMHGTINRHARLAPRH